jgi:hypothetical protein
MPIQFSGVTIQNGISIQPGSAPPPVIKTILLSSPLSANTAWTVPADWSANNTIRVIGGGGGGGKTNNGGDGVGGGGGAYSATANVALTPGATAFYRIGAGGAATGLGVAASLSSVGADSWFNFSSNTAPTSNATGILAKGAAFGGAGQTGGNAALGFGEVKFSGGTGGTSTSSGGPGGGGSAASNLGNGGNGGSGFSGSPDTGGSGGGTGGNASTTTSGLTYAGLAGGTTGQAGTNGGGGGRSPTVAGGAGGAGSEYTITAGGTAGSGGGGGSGGDNPNRSLAVLGGNGGLFGGGGGAVWGPSANAVSGAGAQGAIIITYVGTA